MLKSYSVECEETSHSPRPRPSHLCDIWFFDLFFIQSPSFSFFLQLNLPCLLTRLSPEQRDTNECISMCSYRVAHNWFYIFKRNRDKSRLPLEAGRFAETERKFSFERSTGIRQKTTFRSDF